MDMRAQRVTRREFMRGYTHLIKDAAARRELNRTIAHLLGGAWDCFDVAYGGNGDGCASWCGHVSPPASPMLVLFFMNDSFT